VDAPQKRLALYATPPSRPTAPSFVCSPRACALTILAESQIFVRTASQGLYSLEMWGRRDVRRVHWRFLPTKILATSAPRARIIPKHLLSDAAARVNDAWLIYERRIRE